MYCIVLHAINVLYALCGVETSDAGRNSLSSSSAWECPLAGERAPSRQPATATHTHREKVRERLHVYSESVG